MEQVANANSAGGQPVKRGIDPAIANLVAGMPVKQKIVWRKSLSGISRYQFCPFCIRKEGLKKKDIDRFLSLRGFKKEALGRGAGIHGQRVFTAERHGGKTEENPFESLGGFRCRDI